MGKLVRVTLYQVLIHIDGQYIMALFIQGKRQAGAKPAQANDHKLAVTRQPGRRKRVRVSSE
jgi:hypothetical protein